MIQITPYIAHAITSTGAQETDFLENAEEGKIIINREGEILHICDQGRHLLWLTAYPEPKVANLSKTVFPHIIHKLAILGETSDEHLPGKGCVSTNVLAAKRLGQIRVLRPLAGTRARGAWLDRRNGAPSNPASAQTDLRHAIFAVVSP